MRLFIASLLLCSTIQSADVNEELKRAVSSSGFAEQKLQDLLIRARDAYTHMVNNGVSSKAFPPQGLLDTLATRVRAETADALRAISLLDSALSAKYKEEAALVKKALATNTVEINKKDVMGRTPLHTAIFNNKPLESVIPLLKAGASSSITDNEGISPIMLSYKQCIADKALLNPLRGCWTLVALLAYRNALSTEKTRILYNWLIEAKRYLPDESLVEAFADALTEV